MSVKVLTTNSIKLTKFLLIVLFFILVTLDLSMKFIIDLILMIPFIKLNNLDLTLFILCVYSCSIAGYILIVNLYKLLINIEKGNIFNDFNIKILNIVSLCCLFVAFMCFIVGFSLVSLFLISAAAGFVALIVRIVMQIFIKANQMKNELDLTI